MAEIRPHAPRREDGLAAARLLHFHGLHLFDGGTPDTFQQQAISAFIAHAIDDEQPDPQYFAKGFSLPPLPKGPLFFCGSDGPANPEMLSRDILRWADEVEMCAYWRIRTLCQSYKIFRQGDAVDLVQIIDLGVIHLLTTGPAEEKRISGCRQPEMKKCWFWKERRALDASISLPDLPACKSVPAQFMELPLLE